MRLVLIIFFIMLFLVSPSPSFAYVGPGLAVGTIGVILGVIGSICLAVFAVFWYPVKRALKRKKQQKKAQQQDEENENKEC